MSAAKKFRDHYPSERKSGRDSSEKDKAIIEQYVRKIEKELVENPTQRKKAADIISALINSRK